MKLKSEREIDNLLIKTHGDVIDRLSSVSRSMASNVCWYEDDETYTHSKLKRYIDEVDAVVENMEEKIKKIYQLVNA